VFDSLPVTTDSATRLVRRPVTSGTTSASTPPIVGGVR
jgi:hypothetical protein